MIILRAVCWPFRSLWRVLILGWLVGFAVVGQATMAVAEDGPITAPDLAGGSAQTLFEQAPWYGYGLPTFISPELGWVEQTMWGALNLISLLLTTLTALFVRGALVAMQWMLNLTLYRDNAGQVDSAVQAVAGPVFWPLIACTVAAAGFTMYAQAKRDGNGAVLGEAVKVIVLGVLAVSFVLAPSQIVGPLDDARTAGSNAVMTGYSSFDLAAGGSAAGFPAVPVQGPNAPSRSLADSMWNTFVVTPWCYTAFGTQELCADVGKEFIAGTDRWESIEGRTIIGDLANNLSAGSAPDACVETFADACDVVRGQSIARLGAALVGVLVSIPLALLLLVLTVFGLLAAIGVLFLALMAPLFVVGWLIPGIPRAIGLRWFQALLGCMIQSALIATLLGVVMVLGAILQAMIPTYGFWMVGLLSVTVMIMALRVRAMFETLIGMASPASAGLASSYIAMKTLGAAGRMTRSAGNVAAKGVGLAGKGAIAGSKVASAGARQVAPAVAQKAAALRQHFAVPAALPGAGAPGGIATPYRSGPAGGSTGPRALSAAPSHPVVDALPSAPQRLALTATASSTAAQVGGPQSPPIPQGRRRKKQSPARTFAAGSGTAGPVDSARRRIVQPSRRNIHTPVVRWGAPDPLVVTQRPRPRPLPSRPTPSGPTGRDL